MRLTLTNFDASSDVNDARAPYLQQRHSISSHWIQCQVNPTCQPPAGCKHPIPKALPRSANHIRTVCHQRCRACAEKPSLKITLLLLLLEMHQCHMLSSVCRYHGRGGIGYRCDWQGLPALELGTHARCDLFRSRGTPHC